MSGGFISVIRTLWGRWGSTASAPPPIVPIFCDPMDLDLVVPVRTFDLALIPTEYGLLIAPVALGPEAVRTLDLNIVPLTFDCGA